jgi:hypothetical protein
MFRGRVRHIHFVGVGGVGMSGLAEILRSLEFDVSGSDLKESSTTRASRASACASTSATAPRTSRRRRRRLLQRHQAREPRARRGARARHPRHPRAEMLAELMRVKYGVAIAGSTARPPPPRSSPPCSAPRASTPPWSSAARWPRSAPTRARRGRPPRRRGRRERRQLPAPHAHDRVVTNIDPEHLDHYGSHDRSSRTPSSSSPSGVPFYGLAVLCLDHPHVQDILPRIPRATSPTASQPRRPTTRAAHPFRASRRASTRTAAASRSGASPCVCRRAQRAQLPRDDRRRRRARGPARRHQAGARRPSTASRGASPSSARSTASRWSTTTATTPPRSRPRSTPRAAPSPATSAASSSPSSRTATRARATSSTSSRALQPRRRPRRHRRVRRGRGPDRRAPRGERALADKAIREHGHHAATS